jgi:hypothetical protein
MLLRGARRLRGAWYCDALRPRDRDRMSCFGHRFGTMEDLHSDYPWYLNIIIEALSIIANSKQAAAMQLPFKLPVLAGTVFRLLCLSLFTYPRVAPMR